jgi:hypothetical protein
MAHLPGKERVNLQVPLTAYSIGDHRSKPGQFNVNWIEAANWGTR